MPETKNKVYLKAKKEGILSKNQLEFFNELCLHAPCTVNELIKQIDFTNLSIKPETVDRYPSQLKKIKLISIVDRRTCKVSSSRRRVDVLGPADEYPDTKKNNQSDKESKIND